MDNAELPACTPLVEIDDILVKLECSNPTGSVKDRIARFMLEEAAKRGELKAGDTVVEATSGNTGIAISAAAREMGYRALIFMPEHMSRERIAMIRNLGAEVRLTPRREGFEGPIRIRDTYRDRPGYYVPDQFGNPDNSRCHELTTGPEILRQLNELSPSEKPRFFVAGVGTGGTLMGIGRALRRAYPGIRVVAVEPSESAVMSGGEPGDHCIQGIGDGFIPDLVDLGEVDQVQCTPCKEALAEAERIRSVHGYCVGISSGANMLAARRLASEGRVVTVWPDCANRYGSMGLAAPSSEGTCPLREGCIEKTRRLLGS